MENKVYIVNQKEYNIDSILRKLPSALFDIIEPFSKVVIKPNWVKESHEFKSDDWNYVITHPDIITAVIIKVLERLDESGRIAILDSPETPSSFTKITMRYPIEEWVRLSKSKNVKFEIIDLRDDEWTVVAGVIIERNKLPGDPLGKIEYNLKEESEFISHKKSLYGYYGADYNIKETNEAHNGYDNKYKISKTVIDYDVFINIPKLKTHKKSGITCCLKNLVGVNTYKNYLPHYSLGSESEGGDQFPANSVFNSIESKLFSKVKQNILLNPLLAKFVSPLLKLGKNISGDQKNKIRSGNWYGNDTIWRMIADLNKIVLYGKSDGSLNEANKNNLKKYIGIVDAILAADGQGPKAPDPVELGLIISGNDPVMIDVVCARLMLFDPDKIPMIRNCLLIKNHPITFNRTDDLVLCLDDKEIPYSDFPDYLSNKFAPHFGWLNHIEHKD